MSLFRIVLYIAVGWLDAQLVQMALGVIPRDPALAWGAFCVLFIAPAALSISWITEIQRRKGAA